MEGVQLPEAKNIVLSGKWESNDKDKPIGGCHMYDKEFYSNEEDKMTWALNPQYSLKLKIPPNEATTVRITLSRPDKVWKEAVGKDLVGCMIGFYVFSGQDYQQPSQDTILNKNDQRFIPWN